MENIFTGDFNEAMNVRNLLERAGIEVFTINEHMADIAPDIEPVISPGGFNPVILRINDKDFETARKIVDAYLDGRSEQGNQESR